MPDLAGSSAAGLLAALDRGETTSVALARRLLDLCEQHRHLAAFHYLEPDDVLAAAAVADARRAAGIRLPLLGLPLAIKDNINSAGIPTTAGTPLLDGHRPRVDAPVLRRLLDQGAILLGKTSMHELAFGITGNNTHRGPARNPFDPNRIPGGSSGGTAIAVALGMAPAGLGSDTGGSVRIPAALCGIVGLRPTTGRYPGAGVVPISGTRDTVGPMARTVADTMLLDQAITGEAPERREVPVAGIRLGLPDRFFFDDLDHDLATLIHGAIERLRSMGATIVPVDIGAMGKLYAAAGPAITLYETIPAIEAYLAENGLPLRFIDIARGAASPDVSRILLALTGDGAISPDAYRQAMSTDRPAMQAIYGALFARHRLDGMVFPATPLPAVPIGADAITVNGKNLPTFETFIRNSGPGSVCGVPGISLPCGRTPAGLPVGLAIDGPAFSDRHLLAVAAAIETIVAGAPGWQRQGTG
ncbi:MAG: indoleacetamide hydrolase [Parvibaculaceae bacterium]